MTSHCMRIVVLAILGLTASTVAAQWPPPAPFVSVWIPEHLQEPYQGGTPSAVGHMLVESESVRSDAVVVGTPGDPGEQGCGPIPDDVSGRIAVIRRGGCDTQSKALRAADAGAVAVLIYNDVEPAGAADTTISWQDGNDSTVVSIPVGLTRALTGAILRSLAPTPIDFTGSGGCFDYNGTPDSVPPSQYYPLAVGNAWEYVAWLFPDSYRQRLDVVGDTLVDDVHYFILRDARYATSDPTVPTAVTTRLARFDPVSSSVDGSCPLNTPFDSGAGECFASGSPGLKRFGSCYQGIADNGDWVYVYQAGRGLIRSVFYAVTQPAEQPIDIVYSRVDGVEIGTPYVWPLRAGETADLHNAALAASPRPAVGVSTISFSLPAPMSASLEVFDILGRRVATHDLGRRPAGAGTQMFDVSGLAPGNYTVRLVGEGDLRLSAPLVIAR